MENGGQYKLESDIGSEKSGKMTHWKHKTGRIGVVNIQRNDARKE